MALMGIVLGALLSFFTQGTRISSQSSSRADLQQEVLNVQQLIVGKLREAWYIYPAGQTLTLSSAVTTRNPVTSNQSWNTSTHPILAMILPPSNTALACATNANGCYRFVAYYPVVRSVWISGVTATPWLDPGSNANNAATWVLAEYRANMPASFVPTVFPPAAVPAVPQNGTANLLADFVAPTIVTPGFTTIASAYSMFSFLPTNSSATVPVSGVTLRVATTRQTVGTTLRLPNATDEYTISVYPTNLGKIAATPIN
ncbi:prepilin-type cleavage/methylation domain-containing protein [Deinococcus sp. AJ005]|nr:prepilin-type cleavage/methylation domain-containing protein [Deinococcus sp. AJ005]